MYTLAIVNQKGGVGKTTSAVTLASGLAMRGERVLLVDLDVQGSCATCLGLKKRGGLYELLFGRAGQEVDKTGRENLHVVLGDHATERAKLELVGMPFRERVLAERLKVIAGGYDVCVLDAAPGVDVLQIGALVACSGFLIPVALDHLAAVGAADMLASVTSLQAAGAFDGRFLGILPTMWERRTNEGDVQMRMLVEQYQRLVWPPIPLDVKAREAPSYGMTLWEYASGTRALSGVAVDGGQIGGYARGLGRLCKEIGI